MVQVVEESIQLMSLVKARRLWDELVVSLVELLVESPKHARNGQLKLMVTIKTRWIKYNCTKKGKKITKCNVMLQITMIITIGDFHNVFKFHAYSVNKRLFLMTTRLVKSLPDLATTNVYKVDTSNRNHIERGR